jgi:heat shock protein HslJ
MRPSTRPGGMARKALAALMAVIAAALAACGMSAPPPSDDSFVPQGSWQLVSGTVDGAEVPLVEDSPITLTITGAEIGGTAACNMYGGRLSITGGTLDISDLGMTAMGCEEPVMASEAAYTAALDRVQAIGGDGEELVLRGPGVELRFEALPEPPTADFVGTVWVLETLVDTTAATAPQGERATIEFQDDGTFSGSTGCRGFTGEWQEQGDQILAPIFAMDDSVCPPDLQAQDEHVVTVIGDGFVPTVEESRLLLTDRDGTGLIYRAED